MGQRLGKRINLRTTCCDSIEGGPLRDDVPFRLFLVVQRIRGRPALLLGAIASVGIVGLLLLGLILSPNRCAPPDLFRFVFTDLFG